ncbi:hypothetical protein PV396_21740 [Streptomyces sp. ME02-8801-2C]|uniref:hypothetical protein n=1 Tax=Streptomyces sp. ME02-8801-2C TaxID=3028680 RepID=UPI0029B2F062|nr:hypothetical protein [Streptomyces sp. ME02-8801-2C]MDX3454537.1 hypothetical protein [Streptomyces sp. ME02-8801-2C]
MNRPVPDIAVVAVAEDAAIDQALRDFLRAAGLPLADDGPADVVVVLISAASVDDPEWRQRVEKHRGVRLIPVRVDGVSSSRAPEHLRPINWVTLNPASPVTAFGTVLAASLSDPEHVRELRNLRAQTEAWVWGDRRPDRLIADHRQAAEAHELMAVLREDGYLDTTGVVGEFVEVSYRHTRKARNRKRRRRVFGLVFGAVMALIVAVTLPRILKVRGTDFNALVSFGDPASARVLPEWMSLQSASLLLRGNAHQKALARQTLTSLLSVQWSLGGPALGLGDRSETLDGLAVLPNGRQAALLVRNVSDGVAGLGLYDIREGEVRWQVRLGPGYADIAAGADGRTVVAVGNKGSAVVDLDSRKVRRLAHVEDGYATVRLTRQGDVVVGRAHQLVVGSVADGRFRTVGARYDSLLDVQATTDGGARALVTVAPGRYRLLNALTGAVLASADVNKPLIAAGAVAPDQTYAVFTGADRQLWRLSSGGHPAPTSIAVPERTETVGLLSGGRVIVGGQDRPALVIRLADGGELGVVCRDVPQLEHLYMSPYGDLLGCWGPYNATLWQAPAGPRRELAADGDLRTGTSSVGRAIEVRGDGGRVLVEPSGGTGFAMRLFTDDVVDALALSPDGSQLVAATGRGDVAVVSLQMSDGYARVVARWRVPAAVPAVAVGWSDATPLVKARDGNIWQAPSCPGCTTDEGLIARLKARLSGCWTARQLTNVDDDTRRVLGVRECRPSPEPVED